MRTAQKFAATGLILALGAAGYGIFALGHPSEVLAKKKAAAAQAAPVDQTPLKDAQELAQMADTPGEQELAKKALRKLRHPSRSRKLRAFLEGPSRDYL